MDPRSFYVPWTDNYLKKVVAERGIPATGTRAQVIETLVKAAAPLQKDQAALGKPKPYFVVENWQIPVPIGDASAHFLIDKSVPNKSTIINAFFMDGGDNVKFIKRPDGTAHQKLQEAFKKLDQVYGSTWKFDAIVTTHHDGDHYRGLQELLKQNVKRANTTLTFRKLYFQEKVTFYSGGKEKPTHYKWTPDDVHPVILGEHCVGLDLFSKTRMFDRPNSVDAEKDVWHGIRSFDPNDQTLGGLARPRFVVVGANGFAITQNALSTGTISMNQTSLLAVIYWPGDNGRTSYYTGGDGNPLVLSTGVATWMAENTQNKKHNLPCLPVEMVKLDHHGSLKEGLTDEGNKDMYSTVLDLLSPSRILVTPGYTHGHPNWVVLQLIRRYFAAKSQANPKDVKRLYTTRSPYWMSKKRVTGKDVNSNHAEHSKAQPVFAIHLPDQDESDDEVDYLPKDVVDNSKATGQGQIDNFGLLLQSPEDDSTTLDALFSIELANISLDNKELERQKKRILDKNPGLYKLNPKGKLVVDWAALSEQIQKDKTKIRKDLGLQYRVTKAKKNISPNEEEPHLTEYMIKAREMEDNRKMIVACAKDAWHAISDQPLCSPKHPYFLVRFSFYQDGSTEVDATMDEFGAQKMVQEPDDDEASDKATHGSDANANGDDVLKLDIWSEAITVNYRDREYKYPMATTVDDLSFICEEMNRFNVPKYDLLNYATHNRLIGSIEMTSNLFPKGDQLLGEDDKGYKFPNYDAFEYRDFGSLNKQSINSMFANVAPSLPNFDKLKNTLVQLPLNVAQESFVKQHKEAFVDYGQSCFNLNSISITDPVMKDTTPFSGELAELFHFDMFVERYAPNINLKDKTFTRPKLKGQGDTKPAKANAIIKELLQTWEGLANQKAQDISALYRQLHKSDFARQRQKSERWARYYKDVLLRRTSHGQRLAILDDDLDPTKRLKVDGKPSDVADKV